MTNNNAILEYLIYQTQINFRNYLSLYKYALLFISYKNKILLYVYIISNKNLFIKIIKI